MSNWIPLMDYAIKKSVSISTLRRYIKSNRIKYRTENGKYMLWDDEASGESEPVNSSANLTKINTTPSAVYSLAPDADSFENEFYSESYSDEKIKRLLESLRKAQEEIAELKMLVSIYETLPNNEPQKISEPNYDFRPYDLR